MRLAIKKNTSLCQMYACSRLCGAEVNINKPSTSSTLMLGDWFVVMVATLCPFDWYHPLQKSTPRIIRLLNLEFKLATRCWSLLIGLCPLSLSVFPLRAGNCEPIVNSLHLNRYVPAVLLHAMKLAQIAILPIELWIPPSLTKALVVPSPIFPSFETIGSSIPPPCPLISSLICHIGSVSLPSILTFMVMPLLGA